MVDISDPRKTRLLPAGWLSREAEAQYRGILLRSDVH